MSDEPVDVGLDDGDSEDVPSEVDPVLSGLPPVERLPVGRESMLARIRRFLRGR